jgi:hypothetical protein
VQKVADTPVDHPLQIRKNSSVNVVLSPTSSADPPPLQMAVPTAAEMGADKHLVAYAIRYDATESISPPVGAYGFFARLSATNNYYAPSEPFLIVINNGIENFTQMVPAALAINAAAFLPGDYNHDERVDSADYIIWRKTLNSTTALAADGSYNDLIDQPDYDIWRRSYGTFIAGSGFSTASVPEPHGVAILLSYLASILLQRRSRHRRMLARFR